MPVFTVQIPVTVIVSITVDAPDEESAMIVDFSRLKPEPVYQTDRGVAVDHDAFSIGWIGDEGYDWDKATAEPTDHASDDDTVFVDHSGTIYPDRESRDAAIANED